MKKEGIPTLPVGSSKRFFFFRQIWFAIWGGRFPIIGTNGITVGWSGQQYEISGGPRRAGGAITGWHFESKIEVDNTKSYPAQSVIHIQPTHDLVTTGIRDAAAPDADLVQSCAGYWVSTQDVPAKSTVNGNEVWNLPQYPYPKPTDMDDPLNFWIYLGEMECTA